MLLGYNTNGFAHHRIEDAVEILASIGYRSVAVTVDYHVLNPDDAALAGQIHRLKRMLAALQMRCTIETGSRFILDPRRKHRPTLIERSPDDRRKRFDFLATCLRIASELEADALSFWSGARPADVADEQAMDWLVQACRDLAQRTVASSVRLAFEPEPGMFIETMAQFEELHGRVDHPAFGLTLDVGHVHCLGDGRAEDHIARWRDKLFNLHIEDMRRGVHDHLMFGEGEMDTASILHALRDGRYEGGVHVELSRHSHDAVRTATAAYEYLSRALRA